MPFYTATPLYYTDPGALNATVSHAQADAMVAAAAAVWNVPSASLVLAQGGELAEHVSSANTYVYNNTVVFPADVQATNYLAVPIPIIYDTDGSITDLLLGSGASQPSECPHNAVTESVDGLDQNNGTIDHAVIVLNGNCVGSAPQQLTQMQYQLVRVFGRVLGLGWSQLNDNVFTGQPAATLAQRNAWPLMHPIDIVCGPYTYQCMTNPFTLRDDDLATLALLYPVQSEGGGKVPSLQNAIYLYGSVAFPNGDWMEQVNLTVQRFMPSEKGWDGYEDVSVASGLLFQQNGGNPVSGPEPASENQGTGWPSAEGYLYIPRVPIENNSFVNLQMVTEPINPLYTQEYALGNVERPVIAMSGSSVSSYGWTWISGTFQGVSVTETNAADSCNPGNDGTESSPAPADPSGWWNGLLCGVGHTSWWSVTVQPNRTWTIETTALNEAGEPTVQKAQPVLGVWNLSDMTGILPTVAAEPTAMNSLSLGMTQLAMPAATAASTLRIAVADEYGAGRPDFSYAARILYADSVTPATLGASGGTITITGMGFRAGNRVTVNGVNAQVTSWTSTQIVAQAPTLAAAGASSAPVNVAVLDTQTGGSTTIAQALSYIANATDQIETVTVPASLETGVTSTTPFAVKVLAPDGVTPVAGASVRFAVVSGSVVLGCGSATACTVTTNASGMAQTAVLGAGAGSVTLSATELSGGATVYVTLLDTNPTLALSVVSGANQSVTAPSALGAVTLLVTDGLGNAVQGATVNLYQTAYAWEGVCPAQGPCPAAPVLGSEQTTALSGPTGQVTITPDQQPGVPQVVDIAASAGTQGFVTLSLSVTP
jgi:hypothetical protein